MTTPEQDSSLHWHRRHATGFHGSLSWLAIALTGCAILLSALLWLLLVRPYMTVPDVWRVAVDLSIPPFAYTDDDQQLRGIDVAVLDAVLADTSWRVEWIPVSYDSRYDAVASGQADLSTGAIVPAAAYGDDLLFVPGSYDDGLVWAGLALPSHIDDNSLDGWRIAIEFGGTASLMLRRSDSADADAFSDRDTSVQPASSSQGNAIRTLLPYERPEYALDAVRLGQADAALVDTLTANLYRLQYPDVTLQTVRYTSLHYVFAVDRSQPGIVRVLQQRLARLAQDGTLQRIIEDELMHYSDHDSN